MKNKHKNRTRIAVAGAGRMGRGIALTFAYAGYPVAIVDSESRPAKDFAGLRDSVYAETERDLGLLQDTGVISSKQGRQIMMRIEILARDAGTEALQAADFVFEAVTETLAIKKTTYAWLVTQVTDTAIIASTTSTMLADTLATFVNIPARFCNAHWLNPAWLMPLIEISPAASTATSTVTTLKTLFERIGKVPIVCKASPGYVLSRIQAVALNEAARLVEEGVASAEEIDKAIKTGFGIRYANLGMLEFIDWGGGDILYHATRYLGETIDRDRFATPEIVRENMNSGRNGLRDGIGFYDYRHRDVDAYRAERLTAFVGLLRHLKLMPEAATGLD